MYVGLCVSLIFWITILCHFCDASGWEQRHPPELIADKRWGERGGVWGGFGSERGGSAGAFDSGEITRKLDDREHDGYSFGNKGASDGFSEFARHAADGHIEGAQEAGEHSTNDAEGAKKYSYFTQGSGPNGFYSKGYFGSNGYDHEQANLAAVKDANGGAYRRGLEAAGADTGHARSAWDNHSAGRHRQGLGLSRGITGQRQSEYGTAGRGDSLQGTRRDFLFDHHNHGARRQRE